LTSGYAYHIVKLMNTKVNTWSLRFAVLLFIGLSVWWVLFINRTEPEDFSRYTFGATYGLMALFGGIYGFITAKSWGSFKSSLGRTILFLAAGLLLAEFGQIVFSYYNIVKKNLIPYPSLADIGFFGNMVMYVLGGFALTKVLGVGAMIKKIPYKLLLGIILPSVLLIATYTLFLKGYDSTDISKLQLLLDFGYPLGDAAYVSLAVVTLLCVARSLGGILGKPLLILLFAFVAQYAADFNFLYQNYHETWVNGGYGDFLYLFAYFVMTLSLIYLAKAFSSRSNLSSEIPKNTEATDNG
jgi:hypothetical protein